MELLQYIAPDRRNITCPTSVGWGGERQARFLRKQQMAAPACRIERSGMVHVADSTCPPDLLASAANEAVLRRAVQQAGRSAIVPVVKGTDTAPVIRRMLVELEAHIGDDVPADPVELARHVREWGRSRPTPIPGTRTYRGELASLALKIMGAGPRPGGDDVREVFDQEAARHRPDENDIRDYIAATDDAAPPKRRSPATTDRLRIVRDHLDRVLAGTSTAREAAASFDWKPGAKGGRPPREALRTFAGYLREQIAYAEDDAGNAAALERLARRAVSRVLTPMHRRAATMATRRRLAETGSGRAAVLRQHLAELDGHA